MGGTAFDALAGRVAAAGEPFQLFFTPEKMETELAPRGISAHRAVGFRAAQRDLLQEPRRRAQAVGREAGDAGDGVGLSAPVQWQSATCKIGSCVLRHPADRACPARALRLRIPHAGRGHPSAARRATSPCRCLPRNRGYRHETVMTEAVIREFSTRTRLRVTPAEGEMRTRCCMGRFSRRRWRRSPTTPRRSSRRAS